MAEGSALIYKQTAWTRLTHWIWAISLFFLLLSGLQIFNAHPMLQFGKQSGFAFDNAFLEIGAETKPNGKPAGFVDINGARFDTTGWLGAFGTSLSPDIRAFPSSLTIPSGQDLATGRVVHFFFGWVLVITLLVWGAASLVTGHIRDLAPGIADFRALPRSIADHARLKFHHERQYNVLQKLAYAGVLFGLFPLIILTGLTMSPGMNASLPWLVDLFGGRQTARSLHFLAMLGLSAFFIIHMAMILAAGPLNEMRSILTGWYRTDPKQRDH